ncbi:preprotein translocase subunit SecE [Candidatus Fermentibacteria bacterium]|nr:MAG: preprotein translocase subunit SecE [Candidatus Fermentibacteria bacterium]
MAAKSAKKESLPVRWWRSAVVFLGEVKAELTKVAWPGRDEAVASTWVVIGAVVVVAAWIFVVDKLTALVMSGLLRLIG